MAGGFLKSLLLFTLVQCLAISQPLEQLTEEQFLELIGLVSLANAICRLSLTLCEA